MLNASRWMVCSVLVLLSGVIWGQGQPLALSDDAFELALVFMSNVQPLRTTFLVPAQNNTEVVELVVTHSAVALFSDNFATYWLTVPSALKYPGSGVLDFPFEQLQIGDSPAVVKVVELVDDFSGFFALLREDLRRPINPVEFGLLQPPHLDNRVGMIYVSEQDGDMENTVSPIFHKVNGTFRLPSRDLSGFEFDTLERIRDTAVGAPVFRKTVDPFSGDASFRLVGLVIESVIEDPPFVTQRVIQLPASPRVFDLIFPPSDEVEEG